MNRRRFIQLAAGSLALGACRPGSGVRPRLDKAHIVVVGAGFGGLNVARSLKRWAPELRVTLVERHRHYERCLGSNAVIAGLASPQGLVQNYLAAGETLGIRMVRANVLAVDATRRFARLENGDALPYDRLVVAPGIDLRWDAIAGYDETASHGVPHAWKGGPQTRLLQAQLAAMRPGGTIVITIPDLPYRCPPGPYERASLMAAYLRRHNPSGKIILLDAKTRFSKQAAFQQAWRSLYPGMIEWVSAEQEGNIDHIDISRRVVHTEFGRHAADVLNVIPPQRAGQLAWQADLADASGWCPVEPLTFESSRQPGIHVIGDAAAVSPMPKSAFAAQAQARVCATAIIASLSGLPSPPPRLINHCYSFVAADQAISVTGVYGYEPDGHRLSTLASGETAPDGAWRREAVYARDWYALLLEQTFG